jgi:hypothetical protein
VTSDDDGLFHQVGLLLGSRRGWNLEPSTTPGGPPSWCLDSGGEIELSVSVGSGVISVYVPDSDQEIALDGLGALTSWIDNNEARFLRP